MMQSLIVKWRMNWRLTGLLLAAALMCMGTACGGGKKGPGTRVQPSDNYQPTRMYFRGANGSCYFKNAKGRRVYVHSNRCGPAAQRR